MTGSTHAIWLRRLEHIHRFLPGRTPGELEARPPTISTNSAITLRLASRDDDAAIERLAQLSERGRPPGPCLVAVLDGHVYAALPHGSRELLADPFLPLAEIHSLLGLRAEQLDAKYPAWACGDSGQMLPEDSAEIVPSSTPQQPEPAPRLPGTPISSVGEIYQHLTRAADPRTSRRSTADDPFNPLDSALVDQRV